MSIHRPWRQRQGRRLIGSAVTVDARTLRPNHTLDEVGARLRPRMLSRPCNANTIAASTSSPQIWIRRLNAIMANKRLTESPLAGASGLEPEMPGPKPGVMPISPRPNTRWNDPIFSRNPRHSQPAGEAECRQDLFTPQSRWTVACCSVSRPAAEKS